MTEKLAQEIRDCIREVPDFPKPGINFKDITPILENPKLCKDIVDAFAQKYEGHKVDAIVGVESRGFLFGMMLAQKMNVPFITVRKKGKLPYKTISYEYALEYGTATVEMHVDSIRKGWKVMVHDDLLATGGTAAAAAELVTRQGGEIAGFAFLVELSFLDGQKNLEHYGGKMVNLLSY